MSSSIRDQLRMPETKDRLDPLLFKYPQIIPKYTDTTKRKSTMTSKVDDSKNYSHAPWLLRRTSIHVESTPAAFLDDQASEVMSISTTRSDEKHAKLPFLNKIVNRHPEELHDDKSSIAPSSHAADSSVYGTTVSIEAGKPQITYSKHSKLRELRNLEQAASMRYWAGFGRLAEVWGKLLKVTRSFATAVQLDKLLTNIRTPSYGTPVVTHWFTLATSGLKHRSAFNPPCWKIRTRIC